MTLHKTANVIGLTLFWGWNVLSVFLCVFLIGLAVLPFVFMAAINGEIPLSITICLFILMVTPIFAIVFGAKNPKKVVAFFFGVEIPILILTLFRVFIMRELTLGSGFLLFSAVTAIAVFAWSLKEDTPVKSLNPYIAIALSTIVLITGLYVAILSGLYAAPLIIDFIKGFVSFNWLPRFGSFDETVILFAIILSIFLFGALAFFVFPIFIAYFYPKLWSQNGREMRSQISKTKYVMASICVAIMWGGLFALVSHQGQADYIDRLSDMSVAQKKTEMQNPEQVRKRLLKAYLNEYRYLGRNEDSRNLVSLYKKSTGSKMLGQKAQHIQSLLLKPLLYQGGRGDGAAAGKLYSQLFDSSIQREEKKAITKALEATFNRDDVVAGLMNIGARNVLIREQNIDVQTEDNISVVEIEEVYENLTFENQEIFYYFSLPEDAAITGLWIGQTDKREEMDAYIVAPRGAAQKVYEQQVRRNIDPALLEQVGPAQYRLRVFPIPVTRSRAQFNRGRNASNTEIENSMMRVHMRYVVPHGLGDSVLPILLEKRNVDWSRKTIQRVNNVPLRHSAGWMPALPDTAKANIGPIRLQIPMGDISVALSEVPENQSPSKSLGKLAVIVDTSYSLTGQEAALRRAIDDLNLLKASGLADFDVYLSGAEQGDMVHQSSLDVKAIEPFGSLTARSLVNQFLGITKSEGTDPNEYDAIIVLTDQGLYGSDGEIDENQLTTPLYFLHIDKAAAAYDDDILDAIYRTGGGVATSVKSLTQQLRFNGPDRRLVNNRLWTRNANRDDTKLSGIPEMKALAARQIILMDSFGEAPAVETLDKLHKLATTYDVVTPYSSMIVLVNERQKEALKKASEDDDRFDREGRSGEEALTSPNSPLVSGVPEPHEWLLIILSLVMLFVLWRKRDDWDRVRSAAG